ncbi:hypothetical protein BDR04DRAFT_495494 [Suillus decipiens]|nr:hypothetical protein BDR04DRAFT_495494 [Suillus decipiens]
MLSFPDYPIPPSAPSNCLSPAISLAAHLISCRRQLFLDLRTLDSNIHRCFQGFRDRLKPKSLVEKLLMIASNVWHTMLHTRSEAVEMSFEFWYNSCGEFKVEFGGQFRRRFGCRFGFSKMKSALVIWLVKRQRESDLQTRIYNVTYTHLIY